MKQLSRFIKNKSIFVYFVCVCIAYFILQAMSCHRDDEITFDYVSPQWSVSLHKNKTQSNSIIRSNLIFGDKALIATTDGIDNRFLSCINVNSGEELWRWNNIYQSPTEYFDIDYYFQHENLFFYQVGTRSYCINLTDGSTYFKNRGTISYDSRITYFNSIAYLLGDIKDSISGDISFGVNKMDIITGIIEPFLIAPFDSVILHSNIGDHGFSNIAITEDGRYLVATYAYVDSAKNVNSRLGLYDLIDYSWRYTNIVLSDVPKWSTSVFQIPIIYNGKIFINVGKSLLCHNLWNGKRIWKLDFNADFLFSGFIVEDNQLLANCENSIFYCINPETGAIKWHVDGAGTSTPLRYLNGIVYFSGGSTGRIHAIDTNTGEYVWLLDPANYNHQEDFKPDLYVAPGENGEKGKVIICTPEKAYCLPAYR